ncbi:hypothetical protein FB45DRAFT_901757 [Roridomyces roridus]|uniref:Uncharacterized protein n=1 Tax=Roridomyces roridus TaxID=1738132 RepID=A0AAD7FTP5_9AGAR|nr:hypothetical protein FB45DRAFT_901757 [Roridomyces roridus]
MLLQPRLIIALSAVAHTGFSAALAPTEVLTAPPAPQLTGTTSDSSMYSGPAYTLSCWCETIPYLTTTFCLPCSTVYFTTDFKTTTASPTGTAGA